MEKKDINTLIIPDVHGRTFWKEPVLQVLKDYTNADIIFLGDYLSPYSSIEKITVDDAWVNFMEIVELAKNNKRIKLLLGNHDLSCFDKTICECRYDYINAARNEKFFRDNKDLFLIGIEKNINNKHFVFSHAGYTKGWIENNKGYCFPENVCNGEISFIDFINNDYLNLENNNFLNYIGDVSFYRGGFLQNGSIVWTDIREHLNKKNRIPDIIQIFGHTWIEKPLNLDNQCFCLDCSQAFYIDNEGIIKNFVTNEIIEKC